MQTLKGLLHQRFGDADFKRFFDRECHVCPVTVAIIARCDEQGLSLTKLAETLGVDEQALQQLADADYCDPELVRRLCRQLEIPAPATCPRRPEQP